MGDALAVRRIECVTNLGGILQRQREGQRSLQGRAFDVFHHQVVGPDIVQSADVGMVQRGDGVRFALEALGKLLIGNFDGDDAIQSRVAGLVDFAHAAGTEGRSDLVRTQPSSGRQRHKVERLYRAGYEQEMVYGQPDLIAKPADSVIEIDSAFDFVSAREHGNESDEP